MDNSKLDLSKNKPEIRIKPAPSRESLLLPRCPNLSYMASFFDKENEPMNFACLMEQRLAVRRGGVSQVKQDEWWGNTFYGADLWLRHPDGRGKVVSYGTQVLDFIQNYLKTEKKLADYAFHLPDGFFEEVRGLELKKSEIERLDSRGYTPEGAKRSEVWLELSGGSQERLDKYVDAAAKVIDMTRDGAQSATQRGIMGLYFGRTSKVPTGRLWSAFSRELTCSANGSLNYSNVDGHLKKIG